MTRGNPLKTRKKRESTHAPKAHTRPRPWWPPRPVRAARRNTPRVRTASLEGYSPPRASSASLEGPTPPRARSASLEGSTAPQAGSASLEGTCTHVARAPAPVRAFNDLTPQDARHDPDTPGNRVPALFHRLPGGGHPRRCSALCDEAGVSPVTLRHLPPYG
jgi:hypothetical protein